jgi:hypothetical protein
MRDIAGDRGRGIGQNADQRWRRIGQSAVELLQGKHKGRPQRPQHMRRQRRGERGPDLKRIERQHDQDGRQHRQRSSVADRRDAPQLTFVQHDPARDQDQRDVAHRGDDLRADAVVVQALAIEQAAGDRRTAHQQQRKSEQVGHLMAGAQARTVRQHDPAERHERCRHRDVTEVLAPADLVGFGEPRAERGQRNDGQRSHAAVQGVDDRRFESAQTGEIATPSQGGGEIDRHDSAAVSAQGAEGARRSEQRDDGEDHGREQERHQDNDKKVDILEDVTEIDVTKRLGKAEQQHQARPEP